MPAPPNTFEIHVHRHLARVVEGNGIGVDVQGWCRDYLLGAGWAKPKKGHSGRGLLVHTSLGLAEHRAWQAKHSSARELHVKPGLLNLLRRILA